MNQLSKFYYAFACYYNKTEYDTGFDDNPEGKNLKEEFRNKYIKIVQMKSKLSAVCTIITDDTEHTTGWIKK